ncbi:ABC transporter permease [Lacrimispora sp.]|uniref:ABC transporter permease n=1 Tax=Lacrimispora sp. TaxID=2719234 RepID=UPI0028A72B45|nr:ABC transporter permease subunit [Lacrimispora sp.]
MKRSETQRNPGSLNQIKKNGILRYLQRDWQLYVLMFLPMLFILVFKFLPYSGLSIAFKDYKVAKGYAGSEWVGFSIFQKVFGKRDFGQAVSNTLLLNVLDLVFGFPMPVILALILNEIKNRYFKSVVQTLLYLPHFLSWVIIGGIGYSLFSVSSGVVNVLIQNAGNSPIPFLQDNTWWLISYVLIGVWQSMGWGTIIYLAAITGVNSELYEAARVDGAGRLKQCLHVTIPCIRSTIVTLLIMNLGKLMGGSFERIYALANAKATEYTTTIPVLVYRWGIESGKFSEATALGLFQSVIGLALVIGADYIAKRLGEDGLI